MSHRAFLNAAVMSLVLWLLIFFLATSAFAGPIVGCVKELPESFSFTSAHHLIVGAWEDAAGCAPSGPHARPTAGPYAREFFADGSQSVTMFAALFNTCGSTQMDIREVNDFGAIVGYHDFIFNTGVECVSAPFVRVTSEIPRTSEVPEPATLGLIAIGLSVILHRRKR